MKPEVLDEALGAVLALREQGKTEQAATQLAELQKRFPGENLVERLERLATIAASAKKTAVTTMARDAVMASRADIKRLSVHDRLDMGRTTERVPG